MSDRRDVEEPYVTEAKALRQIYDSVARERGYTQERFGLMFEIGNQSMVWQYLSGHRPLSAKAAAKFARGLGVEVREFSPRLAAEIESYTSTDTPMFSRAPLVAREPVGSVPVVGTVQAGDGGYWVEIDKPAGFGDGTVRFHSSDRHAYAVRVKGDSMRPRIKPGEFVVVEPSVEASSGDEVVVRTKDGKSMVKVLHSKRQDMVELLSINDDHKPITLDLRDIEYIHHVAGIMKATAFDPDNGEGSW